MIRYRHNSNTISGRLHDEMVMMDLARGKYFSLNQVATRIWDLLARPMTGEELCRVLEQEYEVEKEQCLAEVTGLLDEMASHGLVERIEE